MIEPVRILVLLGLVLGSLGEECDKPGGCHRMLGSTTLQLAFIFLSHHLSCAALAAEPINYVFNDVLFTTFTHS